MCESAWNASSRDVSHQQNRGQVPIKTGWPCCVWCMLVKRCQHASAGLSAAALEVIKACAQQSHQLQQQSKKPTPTRIQILPHTAIRLLPPTTARRLSTHFTPLPPPEPYTMPLTFA